MHSKVNGYPRLNVPLRITGPMHSKANGYPNLSVPSGITGPMHSKAIGYPRHNTTSRTTGPDALQGKRLSQAQRHFWHSLSDALQDSYPRPRDLTSNTACPIHSKTNAHIVTSNSCLLALTPIHLEICVKTKLK